jgi:hypothetical protein
MEPRAIEEAFAKLKLLKIFDFYKTRVLTQEQQGWVQFICDQYFRALPDERARINSTVTPGISYLFFTYAEAMAVEAVRERQVCIGLPGNFPVCYRGTRRSPLTNSRSPTD